MVKNRLIWKLYPSYLLVTIGALVAVLFYTASTVNREFRLRMEDDLAAKARLSAVLFENFLIVRGGQELEKLADSVASMLDVVVTVIDSTGRVVVSSDSTLGAGRDLSDRIEFSEAMSRPTSVAFRYGTANDIAVLHVAVCIQTTGNPDAVLRLSRPMPESEKFLGTVQADLLVAGAIVAILAALASLIIARYLSRPLETIRIGAERFASGDLQYKVPEDGTDEVATVARAMNAMAGQLDDRLRTVVRQRNEQQAILSSLVEGVLAVNAREELISLNWAAERLLGIEERDARGRSIQEVVRNSDLQRLIERTLQTREPAEAMITLEDSGERHFQGYTNILRDSEGELFGALVVLNDLTRMRKLENLRRDFVANVSHELKTPITTIKGFVETLIDGAMQRPEEASRFLHIIAKQVDRLNAIIEDLLSLSWIEQAGGKAGVDRDLTPLTEILRASIDACEIKRLEKRIALRQICPEGLHAYVNAALMEQAVINLIDNAIKYSDPNSEVLVEARQADDQIQIIVRDHGCGIESEHLPRLFERFYRVDKARSRKLGGTGLGLSIVKHIVLAHNGNVEVDSRVNEGTTFTVSFPVRRETESTAIV